ncbi:type IV pilin protein [Roseateles koreensis]|uniref:Type IV pilin protein n=1 Tax=Roseateles koreensis TaxID=2987526 RepID=A0ABT5KPU4_9BURK|nr:type IV pilin protein [Roseateles koreensis]MDC8784480.1 type IV pilin protein [Roseateles koreensis]
MDTPRLHDFARRAAPRQFGFTLVELMITLVVAGVLAVVALPSFKQQIAKGRRSDAINSLSSIVQAQERLRSNRSTYVSSLADTGLGAPYSNGLSPGGHYNLSIAALSNSTDFSFGFKAIAQANSSSPQANDSDCASMSVELNGGNMKYLATDKAGNDSSQKCWPH